MTFSGDFLPENFFGIHRIYKVIFVTHRKIFPGGNFYFGIFIARLDTFVG
jgi:hypothetical protein